MAVQNFPGRSIPWGVPTALLNITPSESASLVIDATGEKIAFCGRVFFPARTGTKAISRVGFRFGAVTKAGGSALTVSLQGPLNAGGGPMLKPDETQDQTVAIANGDANFAVGWCRTGTLNANRTVSFGEMVCVVIEYDGAGRLGSDTATVGGLTADTTAMTHGTTSLLKVAGAWGNQAVIPNVILEATDGTMCTLLGSFVYSAMGTTAYASSTGGADEYALEMTFPGPVGVDAGAAFFQPSGNSADAELIFYSGTTAMTNGTANFDADFTVSTGAVRLGYGQLDGILSFAADTVYRLALKPTTTNNITLAYFDVFDANHFQAHVGGPAWCLTSRVDAGAWAAVTTTRRPFFFPYVCGLDDASGGGLTAGEIAVAVWAVAGAITTSTFAAGAINAAAIADGAIDNAALSADTGLKPTRTGTAQAGGASTITLDASASATNDWYNGHPIRITGGTGAEQDRLILDYVGSTKVATVDATWLTNPDSTSTFAIYPASASAADIAAAVLDDLIGDGTITTRQALRVLVAGMAGKLSGAAGTTATVRNLADSANVIVATVDANGNRTAVTVTP